MKNFGKELFDSIKELSDFEVQEKEVRFAMFNTILLNSYNEKIDKISDNFDSQTSYYGKKIEEYANEKDSILGKYDQEFQKIYDKRKEQYFNILNEIQEMQSNQKVALANIEMIYKVRKKIIDSGEYDNYLHKMKKYKHIVSTSLVRAEFDKYTKLLERLKDPFEDTNKKMEALIDKYEKYDGLIDECEKKLEDCINAAEEDFNTIVKFRNNELAKVSKPNIISKIMIKIFGKKKYKKNVIDKMNSEIDSIEEDSNRILETINNQTIMIIAKIEEIRAKINFEFKEAIN